jgi:histidinol dehydrogenase
MNNIQSKPETWFSILERPTKTVDDITSVKEIFKEVQRG